MIGSRDIVRVVERLTAPISRRVRLMIGRAVVQLIDDAKTIQAVQVQGFEGEVLDGVEHFQPFGFVSVPLVGAEAIIAAVGGSRDHAVALVVDDRRSRPAGELAEGESGLYTEQHGVRVRNKADGTVELGTAPTAFVALSDLVDARVATIVTAFNTHTHPTGVGPSGPPAAIISSPQATVAATEVKAK